MTTHKHKGTLALALVTAVLLSACGGGSDSDSPATPPPVQGCGNWPALVQPLNGSGNSAYTQVLFKDNCTLWVSGYYGSSHTTDLSGNSTGFVS